MTILVPQSHPGRKARVASSEDATAEGRMELGDGFGDGQLLAEMRRQSITRSDILSLMRRVVTKFFVTTTCPRIWNGSPSEVFLSTRRNLWKKFASRTAAPTVELAERCVVQEALFSTETFHPMGIFGSPAILPDWTWTSNPTTRSPVANRSCGIEIERVRPCAGLAGNEGTQASGKDVIRTIQQCRINSAQRSGTATAHDDNAVF